jgi:type II secretory pathway component PulK
MMRRGEDGAVLLLVLVALALLAALAGLVIRVSESDLSTLSAERAAFRREVLIDSALASLGARLPASDLAEDGSDVILNLPGGRVVARIMAAPGLINPNFTRQPVIASALAALGASPEQSERLAQALVSARGAANHMAFADPAQVAKAFVKEDDLWAKVAPFITLLGKAETIDVTRAPLVLLGAAVPDSAAEVDFSGAGLGAGKGFYEIWLHVADPALDVSDPEGRLWTHVSALAGADHRLHILAMGWPEPLKGGS